MKPRHHNNRRRDSLVILLCVSLYVTLYVVASRFLAHETKDANGTVHFTFIREELEHEHSLALFFAPLIYIDEKLSGRRHRFDVDYL